MKMKNHHDKIPNIFFYMLVLNCCFHPFRDHVKAFQDFFSSTVKIYPFSHLFPLIFAFFLSKPSCFFPSQPITHIFALPRGRGRGAKWKMYTPESSSEHWQALRDQIKISTINAAKTVSYPGFVFEGWGRQHNLKYKKKKSIFFGVEYNFFLSVVFNCNIHNFSPKKIKGGKFPSPTPQIRPWMHSKTYSKLILFKDEVVKRFIFDIWTLFLCLKKVFGNLSQARGRGSWDWLLIFCATV